MMSSSENKLDADVQQHLIDKLYVEMKNKNPSIDFIDKILVIPHYKQYEHIIHTIMCDNMKIFTVLINKKWGSIGRLIKNTYRYLSI